jgi:hypothetical protein
MPADGWILYAEHAQDTLATTLDLMRSGKPCALVNSPNIEGGAGAWLFGGDHCYGRYDRLPVQ